MTISEAFSIADSLRDAYGEVYIKAALAILNAHFTVLDQLLWRVASGRVTKQEMRQLVRDWNKP